MTRDTHGKFTSLKSKIRTFHRRFIIGTKIATLAILITGTGLAIVQIMTKPATYTQTVYAETKVEATTTPAIPPILKKIAGCESKTGQYRYGQVAINSTQDMGAFQINVPVWGQKAHDMGYDLSKPEDNRDFAIWLFNSKGTDPWISSKGCWGK